MNLSDFQKKVAGWLASNFGHSSCTDLHAQRALFFGAAATLVRSVGMNRETAHALVDVAYDRPASEAPVQEFDTALVSFAALAGGLELDLDTVSVDIFHSLDCQLDSRVLSKVSPLHPDVLASAYAERMAKLQAAEDFVKKRGLCYLKGEWVPSLKPVSDNESNNSDKHEPPIHIPV